MKYGIWLFSVISLVLHGLVLAWSWEKYSEKQNIKPEIIEVKLVSYIAKLPEPKIEIEPEPAPAAPTSAPVVPKAVPKPTPKQQPKQSKPIPKAVPKPTEQPKQVNKPTSRPTPQTPPNPVNTANTMVTAGNNYNVNYNLNAARADPAPAKNTSGTGGSGSGVSSGVKFDVAYLNNPKPSYPRISRRLGEQGQVKLRVQVDLQGRPIVVQINQSSGFSRLDNAAVEAVQKWRFVPAKRDGQAITAWVIVPIEFKL